MKEFTDTLLTFPAFALVGSAGLHSSFHKVLLDIPEGVTDLDFVVLAPPGYARARSLKRLESLGFVLQTSVTKYEERCYRHPALQWGKTSKIPVDVILAETEDSFARWVLSCKVAKALNLVDRWQRTMVYNAIRLGKFDLRNGYTK